MTLKKLHNPKTCNYIDLKNIIFGSNFPWYRGNAQKDTPPYFSHTFLQRTDCGDQLYPETCSNHTPLVGNVLKEIFYANNIDAFCLYRMNLNLLPPIFPVQRTNEHIDHEFPHSNILIYLTNAGGITIVGNEVHDPKEDDIIMFPGCMHCVETSHTKDRVVLVVTFGAKNG